MKKLLLGAGALALLLLFLSAGDCRAQTIVPNGDFQLKELGPWELYGNNGYQECVRYDVTGNGSKSWCWKRRPGTNGGLPWGNGGIKQTINLIAGVQYELTADLAFLCTC